jgi:hypothetical protein
LDGVVYQGTLDLSASGSAVFIKDGITLTGAGGSGPGAINLTGTTNANSFLYAQGTETLDNATISIGSTSSGGTAFLENYDFAAPAVLTLGSNLTVNHAGSHAQIISFSNRAGSGIVNAGTITAGLSGGSLTLGSPSFTNQGTIAASNGDIVNITATAFTNSGSLQAIGGKIVVNPAVTGTGTDEIGDASTLEFGAAVASGQAVTFDPGSTGTLRLDKSQNFSGTVAGLALNGSNFLDLSDISFGAGTHATYSGTSLAGTLTVTDGTHTSNISLLGNYTASTFVTATDGHGGTLVHDPAPSLALFVQAAASFAPSGGLGGTQSLLTPPPEVAHPLLAPHPV